tara:strand:- start:1075 stop:1758 length:684 start_codon:yes stop_codon:yes gene_type:complete
MTVLTTDLLILASGKSSRYISRTKKQKVKINGKSIVDIVISKFLAFKQIRDIYLVTDDLSLMNKSKYKDKFECIEGGSSRAKSVFCGLTYLSRKNPPKNVIIHDVVRPIIDKRDLRNLISHLPNIKTGIGLGYPLTNALKELGKDNVIKKNVRKQNYFISFTPQLFNFDKLIESYRHVIEKNIDVDDDLEVMHMNSHKVKILKSSPFNVKLTYMEDLEQMKRAMKVL